MPDVAACITAYRSPGMLDLLLTRLEHDGIACYVHVDSRSWSESWEGVARSHPRASLAHDRATRWGGVEHLWAILDLLRRARNEGAGYVFLVSGEDYPIKPGWHLLEVAGAGELHIDCQPANDRRGAFAKRWKYRWFYNRFRLDYKSQAVRLANLAGVVLQSAVPAVEKRSFLGFGDVYRGLVWSGYPGDAVDLVLGHVASDPRYTRELQWCKFPEEYCFQTILANANYPGIGNGSFVFSNWKRGDGSGPGYLLPEDIGAAEESDALFARKCSPEIGFLERFLPDAATDGGC